MPEFMSKESENKAQFRDGNAGEKNAADTENFENGADEDISDMEGLTGFGEYRGAEKSGLDEDNDVDKMKEDEFRIHLIEAEYRGKSGKESSYDRLVDELRGMPTLMTLAKHAESKDIAEAIKKSPGADSEEKISSEAADKEPECAAGSNAADLYNKAGNGPDVGTAKAALRKATRREEHAEQGRKTAEEIDEARRNGADSLKEEAGNVRKRVRDVVKRVKRPEVKKQPERELSEDNASHLEREEQRKEKVAKEKQMGTLQDAAVSFGQNRFSNKGDIRRTRTLSKAARSADDTPDAAKRLQYAGYNKGKNPKNGLYAFGQKAGDVVNKVFDTFGSEPSRKSAKLVTGFVSKGLSYGKENFEKNIDRKAAKSGLNGLLGGSEAYKKLKDKYQLHASDMRRAIRSAAKRNSVGDLVNSDKDTLKKYDTSLKTKNEMTDEDEKRKSKL